MTTWLEREADEMGPVTRHDAGRRAEDRFAASPEAIRYDRIVKWPGKAVNPFHEIAECSVPGAIYAGCLSRCNNEPY